MRRRERLRPSWDPQVAVLFSCMTLAMFVAAMDQTVVETALPSIVAELGGLTELPWVTTAYMFGICVSVPLHGKLGDLYGRKRLFLIALGVFLVGSMLCGLAQSMPQLVVFRLLQGVGAGGIIVNSWAVIGTVVPPAIQGRYQGIVQSAYALASVSGPVVGGVLSETLNWRWVFYVNIPLGAFALVVVAAKLRVPDQDQRPPVIDWWGAVLVSGAVSSLILLVTVGGTRYPWTSVPVLSSIAATVILAIGAVYIERRADEPLVPPHLFGDPVIRVSILLAFVLGFSTQGIATFMPLFQQTVDGVSPAISGWRMTPFLISWAVTSALCGRAISRTGRYRRFPVLGTVLLAVATFSLSVLNPGLPYVVQGAVLAVAGTGLAMLSSVVQLAALNAAKPADTGVAVSTGAFSRTVGQALGVAVFGAVFSTVLTWTLLRTPATDPLSAPAHSGTGISREQIDALPPGSRDTLLDGIGTALHGVFLAAAVVAVIGVVIALRLREIPLRQDNGSG
ncbi:EmrB/QacA subfamily drug resistance transporter [Nocardia tenerifensis]|uniref:EmrB/QacA subfamily drug resistance transporter n=1 Tax=Nocardia tenerifensis TaxID=228006 RepID=A0A318K2Y5_9NOCA|nr:MDR family MFS transporter [Nocardia tenerifensis]PXX56273.1 EmrB/QacA subfamily drug resistance transporter [Nocardia tenerifensis]